MTNATPSFSRFGRAYTMVLALMMLATFAASLHAQYDKDGRYVPSPNGIPTDPGARPITNYPGTPGAAIGTPQQPRQLTSPPQTNIPPLTAPIRRTNPAPLVRAAPLRPLSVAQCEQKWTKSAGVTPVEFRRRCHLILRKMRGH